MIKVPIIKQNKKNRTYKDAGDFQLSANFFNSSTAMCEEVTERDYKIHELEKYLHVHYNWGNKTDAAVDIIYRRLLPELNEVKNSIEQQREERHKKAVQEYRERMKQENKPEEIQLNIFDLLPKNRV